MRVRPLTVPSGLGIQGCHELWCRSGVGHRASGCGVGQQLQPIQPLAGELPCATGTALKSKRKSEVYISVLVNGRVLVRVRTVTKGTGKLPLTFQLWASQPFFPNDFF